MIDTSKLNSMAKGHYRNGWNTTMWRPRGVIFRKGCTCTRQHRCPRHEPVKRDGHVTKQ